ncbi:MAG: ABC transporter ATP-binding protein, partial [Clostridia bacterium]|nr:ABC transporter ATP-binding protein [Clostridia bacterium]
MIEVENLTKKYGAHLAVDHISFTISPGHVYGFLGPNGAGKSTTMNMITGCLAPTEGRVLINGMDILEQARKAKRTIGYLPEIPPLYPEMTPSEYLFFVGRAKGLSRAELKTAVEDVMERTGVTDVSERLI